MAKVKKLTSVLDHEKAVESLEAANDLAEDAKKLFPDLASSFKGIIKTIDGLLKILNEKKNREKHRKALRPLQKLESAVFDVSKLYVHDKKKPKPNLGQYFSDIHVLLEQALELIDDLNNRRKYGMSQPVFGYHTHDTEGDSYY